MTWEIAWLDPPRDSNWADPSTPTCSTPRHASCELATMHGSKEWPWGRPPCCTSRQRNGFAKVKAARMRGAHECALTANRPTLRNTGCASCRTSSSTPTTKGTGGNSMCGTPMLDPRIPQREHEPHGRNASNFSRLTSPWLREGAKLWLSANLSTGTMTWSSVITRLDHLKWLQRHVDQCGDQGPCLTTDPHQLRPFIRSFCAMLLAHRVADRPRAKLASPWKRTRVVKSWFRSRGSTSGCTTIAMRLRQRIPTGQHCVPNTVCCSAPKTSHGSPTSRT